MIESDFVFKFDLEIFNQIANIITKYIYIVNNTYIKPDKISDINICCDNNQIEFLTPIIEIIIINNPKPLSYTDTYYNTIMYFLIIYLYYGLVLGEQSSDYVDTKLIAYCIKKFWGNYSESIMIYNVVQKLYYDITISDIKYCSLVRRMFFGMEIFDKNKD